MENWHRLKGNSWKFRRRSGEIATAWIAFREEFIRTFHPGDTVYYTEHRRSKWGRTKTYHHFGLLTEGGIYKSAENNFVEVTNIDNQSGLNARWPADELTKQAR